MWEEFALAAATSLIGVLVGWKLNAWSSAEARREEREHQDRVRVRQREDETAAHLDTVLLAIATSLPDPNQHGLPSAWARLERDWERGWARSGVLGDVDLLDRYRAVGAVLAMAQIDETSFRGQLSAEHQWVIRRSISNARGSIAAFRREEALPARTFPTVEKLRELAPVGAKGRDYQALYDWMDEHPEPDLPTPAT